MLINFEGVTQREDASLLRNTVLYIRSDELPLLPEGDYYHHQIIGLKVISEDNDVLGVVAEILETGANDVCVVRQEGGGEILLPVTDEVILEIDLNGGFYVTVPKLVKDGWVNSMGGKTGKQCSGYAIKSAKRRPQARLFPAKAIRRLMSRAT
jgi:16S rRNA processing protein RimM